MLEVNFDAVKAKKISTGEEIPIPAIKGESSSVDIQINSTSIVEGGVANIPIAGINASKLGVVYSKQSNLSGIGIQADGNLYLRKAAEFDIDKRQRYDAIIPQNIDYAVKAAMCDGKGAEWTDEEKSMAQQRMGINDWELIADVTLEEDAAFDIKFDNPVVECLVLIDQGKDSPGGSGRPTAYGIDKTHKITFVSYNNSRYSSYHYMCRNELMTLRVVHHGNIGLDYPSNGQFGNMVINDANFSKIGGVTHFAYTYPAGTNIKVYGKR